MMNKRLISKSFLKTMKLCRWCAINIQKVRYINFNIRNHIKTDWLNTLTVSVLSGCCLKIGRQVVSRRLINHLNKAKCMTVRDAIFLKVAK